MLEKDYISKLNKSLKEYLIADMVEPKVSVIVPCYNVEKYLEACLNSLIKQTLKDIEIICVDDGSTDSTLKILSVYSKIDSRIKVISQKNSGPANARNSGIKIAVGEFIGFIDSDDWVDYDFFEKLYLTATKRNCDIACATIIRKREKSEKYRVCYKKEEIFSTLEDKIKICDVPRCCYTVNKIYRANFVKNHLFDEGKFFEDILWTPETLKNSNKLVTVSGVSYYYRVNKGSIVKKNSPKKQFDSYSAKKYIIKFFNENNLKLSKKQKTITKEIKYLFNIPILKIKEFENIETLLLFGLIPILKLKNHGFNFLNIFKFKNIDSHYIINFFGIMLRIKHKNSFVSAPIMREYGLNEEKREPKLIVSLTTFPERINKVYLTINCLLAQTLKPDKVILWLADSQFPNKEKDLPENLLNLKEYGLEINWCEDLKSYKKLIPALKDYKNEIIVTFDDDIYYENDCLEKLYKAYLENKNCICAHRYSNVYFKEGKLRFYKAKQLYFKNTPEKPSFYNTIIGCGGVLYPPDSLYKDSENIDLFKKLVPTQDDIWFWAMAILNKTKIKVVDGFKSNLITVEDTQQFGLCKSNNRSNKGMSGNEALNNVIKNYPEIVEILKEEKC